MISPEYLERSGQALLSQAFARKMVELYVSSNLQVRARVPQAISK